MYYTKNITNRILLFVILLVTVSFTYSCTGGSKTDESVEAQEDIEAKNKLQGTWKNDLEGDYVFSFKGDSIYFTDSVSVPALFCVINDTLIVKSNKPVKYAIKSLNSTQFVFINMNGDEVELVKDEAVDLSTIGQRSLAVTNVNQGKTIKKDSVMTVGNHKYHVYTQVNPTTFKVFQQTTNDDGLNVEQIFYDNIVYVGVFDGGQKIFGQDFSKKSFEKKVPDSYLSNAILSEITMDKATTEGINLTAILAIPNSSTTFHVNILISPEGKLTLTIKE